MSFEAGNAHITVTPSMRGFQRSVQRGVENSQLGAAARKKGDEIGKGIGDGTRQKVERTPIAQSVGKMFSGATRTVQRTAVSIGQSFMSGVVRPITSGARGLAQAVVRGFQNVRWAVAPVTNAIGSFVMERIVSPISNGARRVGDAFSTAFSTARNAVSRVVTPVGEFVMERIVSPIASGARQVGSAFSTAFSTARTTVGNVADTVGGFFMDRVVSPLQSGGSRVSGILQGTFLTASTAVGSAAIDLGQAFMNRIPAPIRESGSRLSTLIGSTFLSAQSSVTSAASRVGEFFTGGLGATVVRTGSAVTNAVGGVFSSARDGVSRAMESVRGAVGSAMGSMGSYFTGLSGTLSGVGSAISGLSSQLSSVGGMLTRSITLPLGGAVAAVGGLTAALGWGRLKSVDSAQAQLRGLGYEAQDVERISDQLVDALEGGMLTMGEATSAAAAGMAAGVQEGEELTKYIQLLDAATAGSNGTFDEMNQIFARVQGSGKLMTNELDMIEQRMPGFAGSVADSLGVPQEEMREMVSQGQVSTDDFLDIMDEFAGEMATEYAQSWQGMVQNTMAYIGIIGENILGGVFEDSKLAIAEFIEFLSAEETTQWAREFGEAIGETFSNLLENVRSVIDWFTGLDSETQKMIGALGGLLIAAGPIILVMSRIAGVVGGVISGFSRMFGAIGPLLSSLGGAASSGGALAGVMSFLGGAIRVLLGPIGWIAAALVSLWSHSEDFRESVANLGRTIWDSLVSVFESLWPVLQDIGGALGGLFSTIFTAGGESTGVMEVLGLAVSWLVDGLSLLVQGLGWVIEGIINLTGGALVWLIEGLTSVAQVVFDVLGVALEWVIGAVSGLVGWFRSLGDESTTQGGVVASVFQWISDAASAVVEWFTGTLVPAFSAVWESIGAGFTWIWETILQPVISGIMTAWNNLMTGISWAWTNILQPVLSGIATAFTWLAVVAIVPTLMIIQGAWQLTLAAIRFAWQNILQPAIRAVGAIFRWLWNNVAQPVFGFIRNAFSAMVTGIQITWQNILQPAIRAVGAIFRWLWNNVAQPVFGFVRNAFRLMVTTIQFIWQNILRPVIQAVGAIFRWLWNNVAQPVFRFIRTAFETMSNALRRVWQGYIRPMFQALGDFVRMVWRSYIRPAFTAISDRWNWLKDRLVAIWQNNIRPLFVRFYEFVQERVVDRIRSAIGSIRDIWDRLRNIFRKPINWVITTVINKGLIGAFNKIAGFIPGVDKIDTIDTIDKFATGGAVRGRGTSTSDSILARLSDGEHVLTAKEVEQLGGQDEVYKLRKRIQNGDDVQEDVSRRLAGDNPSQAMLPMGGPLDWLRNAGSNLVESGKDLLGNVLSWARGGLRTAAETLLDPVFKPLKSWASDQGIVGSFAVGMAESIKEKLLSWAGSDDDEQNAMMGGAGGQGLSGIEAFMWALRQVESSNNYRARNPASSASGAYQFIRSTWGGYGGYASAADAPADVQDRRARRDIQRFYNQYGNWEQVAAAWMYPALAGNRGAWGRSIGSNPSIQTYVNKVMAQMRTAEAPAGGGGSFNGPNGRWRRPSQGPITSWYGPRWGGIHSGIDIAGGGPTYAAYNGRVARTGWNVLTGRTGLGILLDHNQGLQTYYGHNPLGGIRVRPGQEVSAGQRIGAQGATGNVTGVHLHWEMLKNGRAQNVNSMFRDNGGLVYPGLNHVLNETGTAEYMFNQRQFEGVRRIVEGDAPGGGGGDTVNFHGIDYSDSRAVVNEYGRYKRRVARGGAYAGAH